MQGANFTDTPRTPSATSRSTSSAAGPIAGFVVAAPAMVTGVLAPEPAAIDGTGAALHFGDWALSAGLIALPGPELGPGEDLIAHPILIRGWADALVTAIDLLPTSDPLTAASPRTCACPWPCFGTGPSEVGTSLRDGPRGPQRQMRKVGCGDRCGGAPSPARDGPMELVFVRSAQARAEPAAGCRPVAGAESLADGQSHARRARHRGRRGGVRPPGSRREVLARSGPL